MRSLATVKTALFGAFGAVALSFFVSTVVSTQSLDAVHTSAVAVRENAGRSVEYLLSIQAGLFHLYYDLDHMVDATARGEPAPHEDFQQVIVGLTNDLYAYGALPDVPGEQALNEELRISIAEMKVLAGRIQGANESGQLQQQRVVLNEELTRKIEHANELIRKVLVIHTGYADRLERQIDDARVWARRKTYLLDLLAAGLTILISLLLTRAFSRFAETEQEFSRLQKGRADELDQFAARVSHDIMNPLGTIRIASEQARKAGGTDAKVLDRIDAGVSRVQRIVKGLYDFARSGARPTLGAVAEVGPVIQDVVEELRPEAAAAQVELRVEPFTSSLVAASSGVLTSLVENLLRNALKHAGSEGGRITVRVRDTRGRVRVEVEDTGPGVPPEIAAHLFEPYRRGKTGGGQGLGLGLATVKRLSEAHGGATGFDSRPGQGSTFWFELPQGVA